MADLAAYSPLVYWVYRSYHLYLAKLAAEKRQVEIEKRHAEEVAALHLRTIESLALAIEAKDHTSHNTCSACVCSRSRWRRNWASRRRN